MSLNLVADTIGVNASYLSNIFKKEKGCSLSKYLTQTRLEQAKKYLTEYPDKTLIEIAESIGYSDVYYFSKNFKSIMVFLRLSTRKREKCNYPKYFPDVQRIYIHVIAQKW